MQLASALASYLAEDMVANGTGRLYEAGALAAELGRRGVSASAQDVVDAAAAPDGVVVRFRGGHSNLRVSLDRPNRQARLHRVAQDVLSLDTEAAVQAGLQEWFRRNGYAAKLEVGDSPGTISKIARAQSLAHLPDRPTTHSTRCRDIMAHSRQSPLTSFHIVEVKGRTQLEADFYETFGQVFPVADAEVTRGWTIRDVPKHGWCLRHARELLVSWSGADAGASVALVVAVPDFPPPDHGCGRLYSGESLYYPVQARMCADFLRCGDAPGGHTFARLLRHLRDAYGLLDMAAATSGIGFRFWGYQGLNWVRDFATGRAAVLP